MLRQTWKVLEEFLSNLPRVALLALAVLFLRNPVVGQRFADLGWYFLWPLQFLLLLAFALAVAAVVRLARSRGDEAAPSLAPRPPSAASRPPAVAKAPAAETKPAAGGPLS